ncbi:hypothetical protein D187_009229 [Cystobacter fuscus DSM 2262]|uniref:Uncharacterized protein n=1 Tax=Cystobacter fuscus (strain ATCC 25194 / DSM 2262 / NBRC 100088 / M29) TaxID=1242864 RepID=S9QGX8_CYSF2|nr:hypothetical protein D187_009229 [Cystobacter fuscus DSM 2262]
MSSQYMSGVKDPTRSSRREGIARLLPSPHLSSRHLALD